MADKKNAPTTRTGKLANAAANYADERLGTAGYLKKNLNKIFPDHWSFMLGEVALYSFVILLLSGTFLTFWFDPSQRDVVYNGSYTPLSGVSMSAAYASTLHLSFDVRGGLLMRQIHHWAALIFMVAIVVHLFRVFFTGAFRKPRETNWLIGIGLLTFGIVEGFLGYSLPDDLLSGTGIRIADLAGYSSRRFILGILCLWWTIPRNCFHSTRLHGSHSASSSSFLGTDHRSPHDGLVPEAHSIPWPRT